MALMHIYVCMHISVSHCINVYQYVSQLLVVQLVIIAPSLLTCVLQYLMHPLNQNILESKRSVSEVCIFLPGRPLARRRPRGCPLWRPRQAASGSRRPPCSWDPRQRRHQGPTTIIKSSDWSMKIQPLSLLENYDRPTNQQTIQPTDQRKDRVIEKLNFQYEHGSVHPNFHIFFLW